MMKSLQNLLEKLYSNEYFGIGLFIVVTILAFSFLIILFFGKKDQKNRVMKENEPSSEENNSQLAQSENLNSLTLNSESLETDMPEKKEESIQEEKEDFNPFASPLVFENNNSNETTNEEPKPKNDFLEQFDLKNFDNPAVKEPLKESGESEPISLDKEDWTLNKPIIEEEPLPSIFQNDLTLNLGDAKAEKEEERTEIPKARPVFPNQFSSVYVNKKAEETPTDSTIINEIIDVPKEETIEPEIKPIKPEFELPKTLDLPKLNKEASNNSIIKEVNNTGINNIINNLENESFEIEKEND